MKKFWIAMALVFSLFIFTGCDGNGSAEQEAPAPGSADLQGKDPYGGSHEAPEEEDPAAPLALLDTVDISEAFGDRSAEGWYFALNAKGDLSTSYGFRLASEASDEEKLNLEYGLGVGFNDLFGIRAGDSDASGVSLYGGGAVSLLMNYRGPDADSEPVTGSFDVGFRHDGDLIWYAGEGESETQTTLPEVKETVDAAMMTETLKEMENAVMIIPSELQKGVSLRFAVEKLIDLGFTAEIDDSDGIAISLKANEGFYTDLLNDMTEEFLPAEWLVFLPRVDFRYERTVFDIRLAFDGNGIFREYSTSSDVSLTASLEVRELFVCESTLTNRGGFSVTADHGAVPGEGDPAAV